MFIENKYTKCYFNIIESARATPPSGYVEKHHIIPRCIGGTNEQTNLIKLSARQHFICHLLLTKMCNGQEKYKMDNAIKFMVTFSKKQEGRTTLHISSRWVEYARINGAIGKKNKPCPQYQKDAVSKANKGKPAINKGIPMPEEQKEKISKSTMGRKAWNKNIPRSDEQKEHQRLKITGKIATDETRAKMSATKVGRPPNNKGKGKHQIALALDLCNWLLTQ